MARNSETVEDRLDVAKRNGVPSYYANGFLTAIGNGDIVLVLEKNAEPVAVVNLSYTMAKTLSVSLGLLIAQIEERAGRDILTSGDIDQLFSKPALKDITNAVGNRGKTRRIDSDSKEIRRLPKPRKRVE